MTSLEEQLAEKTELVASLERSLANQSDYEEMKRELSVIKMVEFSTAASSSSKTAGLHDTTTMAEGVSGCGQSRDVICMQTLEACCVLSVVGSGCGFGRGFTSPSLSTQATPSKPLEVLLLEKNRGQLYIL